MELCPKCNKMSAERNHYTKLLICYNRSCDYRESKASKEKYNKGEDSEIRSTATRQK